VPSVSGLLSSFAPEGSENPDRTERLLRLLIVAKPKLSKTAKRKAARKKLAELNRAAVLLTS
jgi:hypothetical protein